VTPRATSLAFSRWLVPASTLAVGGLLARFLLSRPTAPVEVIHTLCLTLIALAVYSWTLEVAAVGAITSGAVALALLWAWGVRQAPLLGWDAAAFALLSVAAALVQRRRRRSSQRLQQVLDDLREEQTVNEQSVAQVTHAHDGLHKKLSRYQQLQSIAETLSNMTGLAAIAQLAVEQALALIGKSDACLLFLVDKEQQELSLFASKKRDAAINIRAKHGDQFDRYVLRTHRPLLVNDVRRDFRFTVNVALDRPIGAVIACPLMLGGGPEGLLRLDSAHAGAYTQDDLRFLDILLDLAATAVTNARLFAQIQQLAMTDGLTGLALRRPFLEELSRELLRAGRSREPVSVLMVDVDSFKEYNDTYGHMAGDVILKAIAELLRQAAPPGTVIARYGGEEFAVLLARQPRPQAVEVAERIRRLVEQEVPGGGVQHKEHQPSVPPPVLDRRSRSGSQRDPASGLQTGGGMTVSIGLATFPDDALAELELIRIADQRLYQAKRSGRNLVCAS